MALVHIFFCVHELENIIHERTTAQFDYGILGESLGEVHIECIRFYRPPSSKIIIVHED